jgi:3-methylfumaryl-CoA hydratase
MWASGAVEWAAENPLRIGQAIQQRTTIDSVVESPGGKSGRPAVFVTQRREIANDRGVCLVEKRCHVYRAPSTASPPPLPPPSSLPAATFGETYTPSPISLFRFSAITQNAHRIHYDHVYATQVERRDGCLTHGPMTALLLASLAAANHGPRPLTRFDYRATSPIVVGREVSYAGRRAGEGMELWAACGGVQAMRATAS